MSDVFSRMDKYILEHAVASGHDWELKEDGTINMFADSNTIHNGPVCKKCGYTYCVYCELPKSCKMRTQING